MFRWLRRRKRVRRAVDYTRAHPDDMPAVKAILLAAEMGVEKPHHAAEMLAGREILPEEWEGIRARWERAWYYIIT